MVVFGTRPEAIKMCPLIKELRLRNDLETYVVVTGQHREMLKQVLTAFNIIPDYDLDIMRKSQTLFDLTTDILMNINKVIINVKPDLVLVHGDTSTTFVTSLACFYNQIDVGHVEAGLRTNNIYSPFPEEFNRQAVGLIAKYHFAPTQVASNNLIKEGKNKDKIFVTGNTAIDALKTTIKPDYHHVLFDWIGNDKMILITAHRRENLGVPMENMFKAINRVLNENNDVKAIYPVHLNPLVRETADKIFKDNDKIILIEPLEVIDFHNFLNKAYIILTDSGGIQEEAPSLGKPVLVMRETTERPEGVEAGTLKLVGTEEENIYEAFSDLLKNEDKYNLMAKASNPYGDGTASIKITNIILKT
jgi:UDP-N-acetylglucosamine 2-epimerase (non-hydrolysing)